MAFWPMQHETMAQAFYRQAFMLKRSGNLRECYGCLVQGIVNYCTTEEDTVNYFSLLAAILPFLRVEDHSILDAYSPRSRQFWSAVLQHLALNEDWPTVSFLTLGLNRDVPWPLEGVASNAPTHGIHISGLMTHLSDMDLAFWGIQLAICLLRNGADVHSIAVDDAVAVAVVKSAVRTDNNDLVKYVMETSSAVRLKIDNKDENGDTPLHILVKSGKTNSRSGNALLNLLLSYGASVSIPDRYGKVAIDYLTRSTPPYLCLSQAAEDQENKIKQKVRGIKEAGNSLQQQKDYHGALRCYKDAIGLGNTVCDFAQDLAVLHSNCAIVYYNMGLYRESLASAQTAVDHDPSFYKGYWKMGQCYKAMEDESKALDVYVLALTTATMSDEVTVTFLLAITQLLPQLVFKGLVLIDVIQTIMDTMNAFLPSVLRSLLTSSSHEEIKLLLLGPDHTPSKYNGGVQYLRQFFPTMNSGLTVQFRAADVELGLFLRAPEFEWMEDLVIVLMLSGARCESLTLSQGDTPLHAAVEFCMEAGSTMLIEFMLQTYPHFLHNKVIQDDKDRSVYHTVCQYNPTGEGSGIGTQLTELLLGYGFDPTLQDGQHRRPADLVPADSVLHGLLVGMTSAISDADPVIFKEEGNREFKHHNYDRAIVNYTKGIELMKQKASQSSGILSMLKSMFVKPGHNHDLSVLYGNRAECYLKRNMLKEALEDSSESVTHDKNWFKAHVRLGRCLKASKKDGAVEAFVSAYSALPSDADDRVQKEILTELLITISEILKPGETIPNLPSVSNTMWIILTYDFIKNSQWHIAQYAYELFSKTPTDDVQIMLDLRPLCDAEHLAQHTWGTGLILFLLKSRSDYSTLSFQYGDTHLHAGLLIVFVTGDVGVLHWLLDNTPSDVNKGDLNGDTLLHVLTSVRVTSILRLQMLIFLLEKGIDPLLCNRQGFSALDFLPQSEKDARHILLTAMQRASRHQPPKRQYRGKQSTRPDEVCTDPCFMCKKTYNTGRQSAKQGKLDLAIDNFVKVILMEHRSTKHQILLNRCLDEITTTICSMRVLDVPYSLRDLPPEKIKPIIQNLSEKDKWRHMHAIVNLYEAQRLPDTFAVNIPVYSLIASRALIGFETERLNILTLVYRLGGKLPALHHTNAMRDAVANCEIRVIHRLLDEGISPEKLTLKDGDTPLHAALTVALHLNKGDFSLLNRLFDLYRSAPLTYHYLNPVGVNMEGDTLLHAACKCSYNKHSQKAVEFLCQQKLPANVMNIDGKLPIQYLKQRNDRRAQFLRVVGGKTPLTKPVTENTQLKPNSEERLQLLNQTQGIRVTASEADGLAVVRERIKEILYERPDPQWNILKDCEVETITTQETFGAGNVDGPDAEKLTQIAVQGASGVGVPEEDDEQRTSIESTAVSCASNAEKDDNYTDDLNLDTLTWEVDCPADVWKCLRSKHVPRALKERAIHKIKLIASGEWSRSLRKRIKHVPPTMELYEAKLSEGARILWEVDVTFSARCTEDADRKLVSNEGEEVFANDGKIYSEIIRVWDIVLDHDNLKKSIQNIVNSHKRGERSILRKSLVGTKNTQFEGGIKRRYPMLFAEQADVVSKEILDQMTLYPPASAKETEYHILKFYSFNTTLVNIILENIELKVDFPFKVTDKEHAIIKLKSTSPILLIGRSGTGKTTCCLYRLWTTFVRYWMMAKEVGEPFLPRAKMFFEDERYNYTDGSDETLKSFKQLAMPTEASQHTVTEMLDVTENDTPEEKDDESDYQYSHLHQVFVTKNPVLCTQVHKNFYELCHGHKEMKAHIKKETDDLPSKFEDVDDLCYPLFITSKQLLMMLDASLGEPYFFDRNEDGSLNAQVQGWGARDELFGFTSLESDSDEDDSECGNFDENHGPQDPGAAPSTQQQNLCHKREVTYDVFASEIWPKINKMSINYHPSVVWTEIMSFIKGSFEALTKQGGHLSKDEYVDIGRKRAPNFAGEREIVYEIFKRYDHFKRRKFMFDEADVVQSISKRLRTVKKQPWVFHQLYVDETQDFTQAELCVLLRISQDPNDVFLTGDTAQGIMRGISFRFSDLCSLFFYAKKSLHACGQKGSVNVPKEVYQLTHNYRSHAGILSLASAVLDLMVEFFPDSFDRLQKDQGLFSGPLPTILESCSVGNLAILLQGNKRKTSHIEFGAHQAILVVNDSVKTNLPEDLSHAIVLTIYEAKGLEFDDVLLYNFFTDSQANKEWRVVTSFLNTFAHDSDETNKRENLVTIDESVLRQLIRPRPLAFDPNQHKILNSEMKHLYTAITRARVNVWIFDEDEEKRAPMFEYFKARKLVKCITEQEIHTNGAEAVFVEKSSPEDWVKRGDEMMGRCLYEVAAKCYKMGGDEQKEKSAFAHNLALRAKNVTNNPKKMRDEFTFAAVKLLETDHDHKAAICLQNAKEYELAALSFEKSGMLEDAAKMYCRCKKHHDASRCYELLGNYHKAVEVLDNVSLYDQATDCIERYKLLVNGLEQKGKVIPAILRKHRPGGLFSVENLSSKAAVLHYTNGNIDKMMEALDRLPRIQDKVDFLKERLYMEEAATVLMQNGKFTDAATLMIEHGKVDKASEFAEKGEDNRVIGDIHFIEAKTLIHQSTKNQEAIIDHLVKARDAYTAAGNIDCVGSVWLSLSRIKEDKEMSKKAMMCFGKVTPYPNQIGNLEALDLFVRLSPTIDEFSDVTQVIHGVELMFRVIKTLLKPRSLKDNQTSQLYLEFYGLHEHDRDADTLVVYPNRNPRCLTDIPNFYTCEEEKNKTVVEKQRIEICIKICFHLESMLKDWIGAIKGTLRSHVAQNLQCKFYLQGEECPDIDYCPYLHINYSRRSAMKALDALLWEVTLDSTLQSGVQDIRNLSVEGLKTEIKHLCDQISHLIDEKSHFDSCERLVEFLFPENHHMRILTENIVATRKLMKRISMGKVSHICQFLKSLWKFQGKNVRPHQCLKVRSKSTDWFVRATLITSMFRLNLDTKSICQKLEGDLMKFRPKWLENVKMYALLMRQDHKLTVNCIGRKFFEIHTLLQQDPHRAVVKYAEFVHVLTSKGSMSIFPSMAFFLLLQEFFMCLACFCSMMISNAATQCVFPATYLATIPFIDAILPLRECSLQVSIQSLLLRKCNIQRVTSSILNIVRVLCGGRFSLLRMCFMAQKDGSAIKYLQAERCLVFALVALVNTGTFVPVELESPLMSTIMKLSLPEDAPSRLRKSLQAVQQSRGVQDLVVILRDLLFQREEEYLLSCFWKWDPQHRQGIQYQQAKISGVYSQRFFVFDPKCPENCNTILPDEIVELTLSPEEARQTQSEQTKLANDRIRNKYATTLQKCFRWYVLQKRLGSGRLLTLCKTQEMKEMFSEYEITDKQCGICGMTFQSEEADVNDPVEDDVNIGATDPGRSSICNPLCRTILQNHLTTADHEKGKIEFEMFKKLHEDYFQQNVLDIRKVIRKINLRDPEFITKLNPDQEIIISRLISRMDEVLCIERTILKQRRWTETKLLKDKLEGLYDYYTRMNSVIEAQCISKWQPVERQVKMNDIRRTEADDPEHGDSDREIREAVGAPAAQQQRVHKRKPKRRRPADIEKSGNQEAKHASGNVGAKRRKPHHRDYVVNPAPRLQKAERRRRLQNAEDEFQHKKHQLYV